MRTTFRLSFLCLLALSLFAANASGQILRRTGETTELKTQETRLGNTPINPADIAKIDAQILPKSGTRMVLNINGVDYAFRWCPAGSFMMGRKQPGSGSPGQPPPVSRGYNDTLHKVTLTRGFWMLETQVTQAMWESIMGNNPSHFKGAKLPVEKVSWNDSQEYIKKLNALLASTPGAPVGFKFTLPTEAQWEYACRAGTTTAYHFGDTLTNAQANFGGGGQTTEVGKYPANAWGLRDMHGNVFEWCQDWLGNYPGGDATDPKGDARGYSGLRVIRGGSWNSDAGSCRSADRNGSDPSSGTNSTGLRLSLVP